MDHAVLPSQMTILQEFGWGCLGNVADEVVLLCTVFKATKGAGVPALYRDLGFYAIRLLLVAISGGVVIAYGATDPWRCLILGAAAPRIISTWRKQN